MNKKIQIWIIGIFIGIAIIIAIMANQPNETNISEDNTSTNNVIEISQSEEVTDECIDEWDDYNKYVTERIEEASNVPIEDKTHYLLKDVLGYIEVYYLDENNNEYLYKKTTIATAYLTQEDIDDLQIGIEVIGTEAMNKMLEDFE